mmetsp:Transcript_6022/g.6760  ORF Transcript_6022/g.6760 Transcript_6022/m.6760 type:complete len:152 (-) Transcript_6022:30-485(-)
MEVADVVADDVVVDDEKMLLILLRAAEGLGTNETLPSRPNAPVPNEDINEVVRILKEVEENDGDDDDRFEEEGGNPIPLPLTPRSRLPSLLLLDFLDLNNFIRRCSVSRTDSINTNGNNECFLIWPSSIEEMFCVRFLRFNERYFNAKPKD